MLVGYARVSTQEQDLALQLDALRAAGCGKVFEEKASGAQRERPALQAALDYMRAGRHAGGLEAGPPRPLAQAADRDRRGVSATHGIGLRSLTEAIDTATAGGRLVFHLFAALAEFERGVIRERTLAGLQAARARGRTGGRPPALKAKDMAAAKALLQDPGSPWPRSPGAWAWHPRPSTAICPGPVPRPWTPSRSRPCRSSPSCASTTRSTGRRSAAGSGSCAPRAAARSAAGRTARSCAIWAMAAGGTRQRQTWRDGRGRKIPSPAPAEELRRSGRPRWCWRRPISTMTRRIAAAGTATSRRSASGATCCMTGPSTGGGSG